MEKTEIQNFIIAKRNPETAVKAINENPMLAIICNMHEIRFYSYYFENPSVEQLTDLVYDQIEGFRNYKG